MSRENLEVSSLDLDASEIVKYEDFCKYLDDWTRRAKTKFLKGIIEHRGDELDNPSEEMDQEIMDLVAYKFFLDQE